jgi:hypothetical protein
MDNKENEKRVLTECQNVIVELSNRLGRYINDGDIQGFQILTKAVSGIVDMRQRELTNSMRDKETE